MFNRKLKEDLAMLTAETVDLSTRISCLEYELSKIPKSKNNGEVVAKKSSCGKWVALLESLNLDVGCNYFKTFDTKAEAILSQVGVVSAADRYGLKYKTRRKGRGVTFTRVA